MKKTISQLREEIDSLDLKILSLIEKRANLVKEVGEVKGKTSSPIYVPQREESIFKNLAQNSNLLTYENIRGIFTEIISSCRNLEKHLTVYTLGNLSPLVAYRIFGNAVSIKKLDTLEQINNDFLQEEFFLIEKDLLEDPQLNKSIISKITFSNKEFILFKNLSRLDETVNPSINIITFQGGSL